jgi:excisionase family DNA binding protein
MSGDRLSAHEAAELLGVSARRVRALVAQGDLDAMRVGTTLLIGPESVARHRATVGGSGRPLAPRMSWAALLTDIGTTEVGTVARELRLSASERGRLLQLRHRPITDWSRLVRRRARSCRYAVRPSYVADILSVEGVIASGVSALDAHKVDLTARVGTAEFYATASVVARIAKDFSLLAGEETVLAHVLPDLPTVVSLLEGRRMMPAAVVAVDLLETGEPRARRAGFELLERILGESAR